ncbi:hypothetical protein GJAV_G00253610 [Gymnothorax javanicus]|nr:hypothetical protein GJAV_G00253610 [Gymnothorax javanicus]
MAKSHYRPSDAAQRSTRGRRPPTAIGLGYIRTLKVDFTLQRVPWTILFEKKGDYAIPQFYATAVIKAPSSHSANHNNKRSRQELCAASCGSVGEKRSKDMLLKMFDAVRPLCPLQLCVFFVLLSRVRGEVSAPASLQAVVGLPITIGCNFTAGPGETLEQVRWEDRNRQTLLTHKPGQPASITSNRVDQTPSQQYTSAITIKRVEPSDEGVYACKFDVYPSGQQTRHVELSVTGRVTMEGNRTAVSGTAMMLSCSYSIPDSVHQVLWQKTAEQGDTSDVASFAERGGAVVTEPFRERMSISQSIGESHLSIKTVKTEDEGCYTCVFNTYPEGSKSATACLTVYVLPKPEVTYRTVSQDVIEANCTALARPPAHIFWNVAGDNKTLGPAVSSSHQQGDGTVLVVSTLLIQADLLDDQSVKCLVYHQGLESPMSLSLKTKIGKALAVLISVTTLAAVLIICFCVCLWRCLIRRAD